MCIFGLAYMHTRIFYALAKYVVELHICDMHNVASLILSYTCRNSGHLFEGYKYIVLRIFFSLFFSISHRGAKYDEILVTASCTDNSGRINQTHINCIFIANNF